MEYDNDIGKWIIDTDPGSDDSFAILFGLIFLKENLIALSVVEGNSNLEQCYLNAKKICSISERFVPVYKGCELGISNKKYDFADYSAFHGQDGLFNLEDFYGFENSYMDKYEQKLSGEGFSFLDCNSSLKMIELSYKLEKINILTIGRLTNIAVAYMIDPTIVNRINKIVIMGGSYKFNGNSSAGAEFNFFADPIAAKIVINNFKNVMIYPWEPCEIYKFNNSVIEHCIHDNNINLFCRQILIKKMNSPEEGIFADYGAALCAFYPQVIKSYMHVHTDIVIEGTEDVLGAMIIANKRTSDQASQNKCCVIKELDYKIFVECFKLMIRND
jgi:inosine-uridine nucleoside N-ribohydrolase